MEITKIDQIQYDREKDSAGTTRWYYNGTCENCGNLIHKRKCAIATAINNNGFWEILCTRCGFKKSGFKIGEYSKLHPLRGNKSSRWNGGRTKTDNGYVLINVDDDDLCLPMRKKNRTMLEHRYVMSHHLGRCLSPYEIVHHKNHIVDDNRLENLELVTYHENIAESLMNIEIKKLKLRIVELENKVKELENK